MIFCIDVTIYSVFTILFYKYPLEREPHVSLLIGMGFFAVVIVGRMGYESIDITLHYTHMFPLAQKDMTDKLNEERVWCRYVHMT